jgi:putative phosphonate metabolism protein
MPQPRYAIYFVPAADTPLYRFGSSVLGYDCYTGRAVAPIDGVDAPSWAEVVREPRVYGFHATLKPPFYLASGADEAALQRAVVDFAAGHPAVLVGDLSTRELGLFIALVPEGSRSQLDRLAHACVKEFDRFRAPLEAPERARRLASDLSSRQVENLDRWGYPYVFEDFRFHMTLTGALPPPERSRAFRFLSDKFEQSAVMKSLSIDQIAIARQRDGSSPFQVMLSAPLGQSPSAPRA